MNDVDRLDVLARYEAGSYKGNPAVIDTEPQIRVVIAVCGLTADAERITAALNNDQGAVAIREAAEAVSAAWDAWMEDEEGEGQDAVAEAIGALRSALGGQ